MKKCKSDPCVLYKTGSEGETHSDGVAVLQVDDVYGHGNEKFLAREDEQSQRFLSKPRKLLQPGDSAQFNGSRISVLSNHISMDQSAKLENIKTPENRDDLVSARAQIQYIASSTRPDLCAAVQLMASEVSEPKSATFKKMEDIIKRCYETKDIGLKFVP